MALMTAVCPRPTPLTVYNDEAVPENSITCYLGVSGCIGDVPFTAMVSNACGHTGIKACKHCFLLGRTVNDGGETLKPARYCGYDASTESTVGEAFDQDCQWHTISNVCFAAADGTFNEEIACKLRVTGDLHSIRADAADGLRRDIKARLPLPDKPEGAILGSAALAEWQDGMLAC